MVVFWILATLMTAVAMAFVLVPLLRSRAADRVTAVESNLEVLRSQRREIEADVDAGLLPADAREEALRDLVGRAAEDLPPSGAQPAAAGTRKPWPAAIAAAVAVPALAFGIYLALGQPLAVDPRISGNAEAKVGDKQIEEMVASLARKVRERPDDVQGWGLLARSMSSLGRFPEAAEAYAHLVKISPPDAQVLADYADVLAMAQGRNLQGRPYELVRQALELDPTHKKALALAASAAMDANDSRAALGYWERLAREVPPDSDDARQVQAVMAEIRAQSGAAAPPQAAAKAPAAPAAAGATISGRVTLAKELAGKVSGQETLFIFARAEGGPRVPLAVVRATAGKLPMEFTLDDTQAMAPGMNISSAAAVRVEARVSRSGNATAQPGDLVGSSGAVKPGTRNVMVVVDKVVP